MSMREYRNSNIDCGIWQSLARAKNSELQCLSVCDLSLVNIFPPKGAAILKYFMTCREAEFFRGKTAADNWHLKILITDPDMPQRNIK